MGIFVNPGNHAYKEAVNSRVYVDKSRLVSYMNQILNTNEKHVCVSRPRRFGKSMAADMLAAYYSKGCDSRELFDGLKAEKGDFFDIHLNQHNVIRLDIQRFLETEQNLDIFISAIEKRVASELIKEFPQYADLAADRKLKVFLDQLFSETGERFIFIIDEWDSVFRLAKDRTDCQQEYLNFLRGLFKGADYVELAYMTGILPIKKYGDHSAINIFDEYSMIDSAELSEYFGFTEEEVSDLCRRYNVEFSEVQRWYDGYLLNGIHIYNPKSVVDVMRRKKIKSYWTGTETYEALKVHIDRNFDGLKESVIEMLGNGRCKVNAYKFQNDMTTFKTKDDVLTLLVHLGYLAYDEEKGEVFIPNQEIAHEFYNAVDDPGWEGVTRALDRSEELLKNTWAMNGDAVADGVAAIHDETASMLQYNNEKSLTCTLLMAYYSAKAYYMNPIMELPSGKGYADVVYLPKRSMDYPALVIELKWNKSVRGAITQIKSREYTSWIEGYTGDILLVAINYDKGKKVHECAIEKYVKE